MHEENNIMRSGRLKPLFLLPNAFIDVVITWPWRGVHAPMWGPSPLAGGSVREENNIMRSKRLKPVFLFTSVSNGCGDHMALDRGGRSRAGTFPTC